MEIEVKQEHIDRGERDDCFGCPVVLAIMEATGTSVKTEHPEDYRFGSITVGVSSKIIVIDDEEMPTPGPVRRRINHYDRTGKMKPFKFELPINGGVV